MELIDYLSAGLDLPVALALLVTSCAASFITAAFGIGGGGVMLAVLASLLPPAAIIPVHGIVQLGSNTGRTLLFLRHTQWQLLGAFALGSLVGVALGGALVVQLHPGWLQIAVGCFVLWTVFFKPPAFLKRSGGITGAFCSFLTMFIGGTGPMVAAYVKAQELERHAYVGTHAMLMTVQHGLKTFAFGLLGFAFAQWAGFIAALVAAGFLGTWLGRMMLSRIDEKRFKLALNAILVLLSARLIWAGAMRVWG